MSEAVVGVVTEVVLGKVVALATQEITLVCGMKNKLKKLEEKLGTIQALLSDAHSKQISSNTLQHWLKKLKSIAFDADIVLDEFGYELIRQKIPTRKWDKVRCFFSSSNPLSFRVKMAHKIEGILSSLDEACNESRKIGLRPAEQISTCPDPIEIQLTDPTDPFVDELEIVGRDSDISTVKKMLTSSDYNNDLPVITIVGMAGQGKTTLAQLVYNNDEVVRHFEKRIWICVSDDFKVERLLNEMLQSLTGNKVEMTNREALVNKLQENLKEKRYLLVLDDVWNENRNKWESMRKCLLNTGSSKGSKIMVTTRTDIVAEVMNSYCHNLQTLSSDYSWKLFEKIAFAKSGAIRTQALLDIGRRIVKRCGGVPLAIKAIGGLLYSKKDEREWSEIDKSTEIWNNPNSGVDRVYSSIKLSYDHLPSLSLKQCFAACSIFPKDTLMNKDILVQMWMAQGLINPSKGSHLQMEDIGSNYVNMLLRCSLLQDPVKDLFNNVTYCKMHDLVHDFSLQVSDNHCFNMMDKSHATVDAKAMHLLLISDTGKMIKKKDLKEMPSKLRTLFLNGSAYIKDILASFRYLSILNVNDFRTRVLPNEIGEMKLLRYLDIVDAHNISRLPDSFTKLYNLQTLRVHSLEELPKGFGNLINLRHFWMERAFSLPGIRQLTNLRTLPFFFVNQAKKCQLEELENLDSLGGILKILWLKNARHPDSTGKANLWRKSSIQSLELHWEGQFSFNRHSIWEDGVENQNGLEILEGLKPHPNLKCLKIKDFKCSTLPSWMITKNHLCNLVKIELKKLTYCEQIPSLGTLPFLQIIEIDCLGRVKRIGQEFYSCTNLDGASRSNSSKVAVRILFPALRKLELVSMYDLLEWSDAMIPSCSSIEILPRLEEFLLNSLPELVLLPYMGELVCLQRLEIMNCKKLTRLPNSKGLPSLQELKISDCPNLTTLLSSHDESDESLQGFGSVIKTLYLHSCPNLVGVPDIHSFQSLRDLSIVGCDRVLESWTSLETLTSLEELRIYSSSHLWPKHLQYLTSLETLQIGVNDNEPFDYFPWNYSSTNDASTFVSLKFLTLIGWRNVKSLPEQIQCISGLRKLSIHNFYGLETLPEWLGNFPCLESLVLWFCKNLKQLPSAEALQRLTTLQALTIYDCPLLQKRCTKYSGAEWHKIAHIPELYGV
ncbi:hypothetical protein ACH5RR_041581 [Cinchona calisaya]|uniref:Uncharacterized protein n=1 Tax=Cinchona calisaya TaxID=153742 RepID=A0ABD2XXA2_9GENT